MEFEEQDLDVIRLLAELKKTEGNYPVELMASRRQSFARQIAVLGMGAVGAAFALNAAAKGAGGFSITPIASTIVEAVLIVAIVAEVGIVAFINRQEMLDLFRTIVSPPGAEQISTRTPPDSAVPLVESTLIETLEPPEIVTETATFAPTSTAVSTPSPEMLLATVTNGDAADTDGLQADSTPAPHVNNGNHFGQTPKPERTRDTGGDGDSGGENPNSKRKR